MKFARLCAVFAVLVLAACAAQPEIPYDHTTSGLNKTIGLLTPGWPSAPTSFLASDPGRSFGLIGALVDAGIEGGRESDLKALLLAKNIDANALFVTRLTSDLKDRGYTVVPVSADPKRNDYLKKYPGAADNIDSYLDVAVMTYGYLATGIAKDNPYRPWLATRVKLVRASDSAVLMQDTVTYNAIGERKNSVTLSPDPQYAFVNWSDTKADPDKTAAGIADAAARSADAIVDLLK